MAGVAVLRVQMGPLSILLGITEPIDVLLGVPLILPGAWVQARLLGHGFRSLCQHLSLRMVGIWTSQLPIHRIALCCGELIISARCSSSVACARSTNRDRYSTFSSVLEGSSLVTEEIMNYNQRLQSFNSRAGKEPPMQSKYEMGTMLMTALFHKLSVKAVNVSLVPA